MMQTDLRLILLIIGFFVITAIFLDGMKRSKKTEKDKMLDNDNQNNQDQDNQDQDIYDQDTRDIYDNRNTPISAQYNQPDAFDALLADYERSEDKFDQVAITAHHSDDAQAEHDSDFSEQAYSAPAEEPYNIIAVNVIAKSQLGFSGKALLAAMSANKLKYGSKKMYHYYADEHTEENRFYSAASMVEPGTFDMQNIALKTYPGIMLFMLVKKVSTPIVAFEAMLNAAYDIAGRLNAIVCDIHNEPLSESKIDQLRMNIRNSAMQKQDQVAQG